MILKKAGLLFIINMVSFSVYAQLSAGIIKGISSNYTSPDLNEQSYTEQGPLRSTCFSVLVGYRFHHQISVELPLTYLNKGYTLRRTGPYTGIGQSVTNSYLQLPILFSYEYGRKDITVFISAGPYLAYWLRGGVKGITPDIFSVSAANGAKENFKLVAFDDRYEFNSVKDRRFETGIALGSGINYHLSVRGSLRFQVNYFSSLINQEKRYMIYNKSVYNHTVTAGIGYIYNLTSLSNE